METLFVPGMKVDGREKKRKATKLECEIQELLLYDNREKKKAS